MNLMDMYRRNKFNSIYPQTNSNSGMPQTNASAQGGMVNQNPFNHPSPDKMNFHVTPNPNPIYETANGSSMGQMNPNVTQMPEQGQMGQQAKRIFGNRGIWYNPQAPAGPFNR